MSLRELKGGFKAQWTELGACLGTDRGMSGGMDGWVDVTVGANSKRVKIGRDHWNASGPVKKSPVTLWAQCLPQCKQQHLCVGDRCFSTAQSAAASLLRCMMLQSPGAFLLTLSCLSSFKITRFVSKTIPQSCWESLVFNLERGTERIRCKHRLTPALVDSCFCTLATNRSSFISSVKEEVK